MKKGYKRLLVFESFLALILLINSFFVNFLSGYGISFLLIGVLIAFKCLFGFEKDRHRYTKDIILDVIIFLIVFLLLYYLFGIIIGFYRSDNYYSLYGLYKFIFPIICYVLLREYLRYMFMCKSEGNFLLISTTILLFTFFDITSSLYFGKFETNYDIFVFIALYVFPAISSNIMFSYITSKTGYKPLMLYSLVINLYPYLLPIVPNPSQYLVSVIDLLLPVFLGYSVYKFFKKRENEKPVRDYHDQKKQIISLLPLMIFVVILVYFTSGYFRLWAIVIASGSMTPEINKGDAVIIDKKFDFDSLNKGQIIAYKSGNIIVVHRIVKKEHIKDNYYYVTKGDSNESEDNLVITENMIIGTVDHKIPLIGLPKVWLNDL
ncbi:MAG: signal peptidase I [Bacilli bacterium]|nr:signal peptidase I [Bacilli bacterium]